MNYSIELIADYSCHLGENPIWDSDKQRLYWLDILQGRIYVYSLQSKTAELFYEGEVIGGLTIQQDGGLLLFMEAGRIALLKDGRLTSIIEKQADSLNSRFNDVIATPAGNVFCGTLSNIEGGTGSLYRLHRDRTLEKVIDGVGIANGMGFSPDLIHFYFTDSSPARTIYRYRYNQGDDTFHDETAFVRLPEADGLPDGLTIDSEGCIWSASWGGGKVIRFTPSGKVDWEIQIPGAHKVSSLIFGGPDYKDLYITTAGGNDKSENGEYAGALFCIHFENIKGRPEYRSRIELVQ